MQARECKRALSHVSEKACRGGRLCFRSLSFALSRSLSRSLSLARGCALSHSLALFLALSFFLTLARTHTLARTRTHATRAVARTLLLYQGGGEMGRERSQELSCPKSALAVAPSRNRAQTLRATIDRNCTRIHTCM